MKNNPNNTKQLSPKQRDELLAALNARFEKSMGRHQGLVWAKVQARLEAKPDKLWSLAEVGIALLTEEEYLALQKLGEFDSKTSSWIAPPADIRELGGALHAERRYGRIFIGHNGAQSYYAVRGFRGSLRVRASY